MILVVFCGRLQGLFRWLAVIKKWKINENLMDLITNNKSIREQCFVKRQPESKQELEQMIRAMVVQDSDCIRYGGKNAEIQHQ